MANQALHSDAVNRASEHKLSAAVLSNDRISGLHSPSNAPGPCLPYVVRRERIPPIDPRNDRQCVRADNRRRQRHGDPGPAYVVDWQHNDLADSSTSRSAPPGLTSLGRNHREVLGIPSPMPPDRNAQFDCQSFPPDRPDSASRPQLVQLNKMWFCCRLLGPNRQPGFGLSGAPKSPFQGPNSSPAPSVAAATADLRAATPVQGPGKHLYHEFERPSWTASRVFG